jgi:hypothetical protein
MEFIKTWLARLMPVTLAKCDINRRLGGLANTDKADLVLRLWQRDAEIQVSFGAPFIRENMAEW